jgi:hypothetical protein
MASAKTVDLFGEDEGHEAVIKSILYKIHPTWKLKCVTINRRNQILKALIRQSEADILILAKDSNAEGVVKRRNQLSDLVHESKKNRLVLCTPDPYIEKWLLLDSAAFKRVFGKGFDAPKASETHGYYKDFLRRSIVNAGHTTKTGLDRAADIIHAMDFDTIQDDSFQSFITELKTFLQKEQ